MPKTKDCVWVLIDGEWYVPCMNGMDGNVPEEGPYGFQYCPYCGKDIDLKGAYGEKDKASIKKAMAKMKAEHDKEQARLDKRKKV